MTVRLLLAPAAAGKTAYVLDHARAAARSLHADVRVCVPTGLQANAWQGRLAAAGGAIGVRVLTFNALVAACLDAAGEAYTELSEPVQYRLLRTIIQRLPLQHYAPLQDKPGFVQVAGGVIDELKAGLVDPLDFARAVADAGDEPRLRELAHIYTAYQEKLQQAGWADLNGLHWLAVEALGRRAPHACRDWPLLIIDGFDDFTSSQLALLKLLAGRVGECLITLPRAAAVDYPRYAHTRRLIEETFGVTAEILPFPAPPPDAALAHLAAHLFTLSPPEPLAAAEAITLCEAPDRAAEVRLALRWLKQRVVEDGFSPGQVALLARDIGPYRAYARQIAAEMGLPVRLVDGLPLAHSPVIAALLDLLRLFLPVQGEPGLPRRPVISAWRSPYFAWESPDLAITAADADALDTLAREQRVIRGLAQWRAAFAAGLVAAAPRTAEEDDQPLAAAAVQRLRDRFDLFLQRAQPPPKAPSLRAYVAWLEALLGPDPAAPGGAQDAPDSLQLIARARANAATAEADIAALRALNDILRGLVWAEEAAGEPEPQTFVTFFNELAGAIAAARYLLPAGGREQVLVANAIQLRGLSFAAVAVIGLSEGTFPATISEDPFLRDADRERLSRSLALPLKPSTVSAERELFYEAVTRPRHKLLLTRPMLAENGAEWLASPFWEAARRLSGAAPRSAPGEAALAPAQTASWAEWWEALAGLPGGHLLARAHDPAAWERIETAAHIWQARQAGIGSVWDGDLRPLAPHLAAQHGPDRVWSASRLETYQTCGFLFFLQYVLGLQPRPEPAEGLDARQLGGLYHAIFERVTALEGLDYADQAALLEAVTAAAQPILDAAPAEQGFRETPWWRQTRQEIIANVAHSLAALAAGDYTFLAAERSFGIHSPPLVIDDGRDRLLLRGFIDRLDRAADGRLRIIDYKLGSPAAFSKRAFADGRKLQLPLYALAAQETLGLGPVAEGFYWHFRQAKESDFWLSKADGGVDGAVATAVAYAWEIVSRVRQGQFAPRPPAGESCPFYCPAAGFCWQYTPRGW